MRLLFDQNLSVRLVLVLADLYPNAVHVRQLGLERADDEAVWKHAAGHGFTIVSKDADFHQLSFVRGQPPKVIWIRRGNCSTQAIQTLLRDAHPDLVAFERDADASFLALG